MRRVATELGVGTMSLYRYVPGKGELLDLMLDAVGDLGQGSAEFTGLGWRAGMERVALGMWEHFQRHPWLIGVNQARPILGPRSLAAFDVVVGLLADVPLRDQEKISLIMAIEHLVYGTSRTFLLRAQAAEVSGVSDEEFWSTQYPLLVQAFGSGRFPHVATLADHSFSGDGPTTLRFGVAALLDGFEALLAARSS